MPGSRLRIQKGLVGVPLLEHQFIPFSPSKSLPENPVLSMASSPPMFDADTFETKYEPAAKSEYLISFAKPGSHTVATGIHGIDMDHRQNLRLNTSTEHVDELQSKAIINTWGDSKLYTASMSWVRVSNENPYGIQAGRFDGSPSNRTTKITFARPYEQPPSVVAWLSGLDLGCKGNWRLKTEAKDITREGFTLSLDTWSDTQWFSASANWIAHHADHHGIFSGSYNTEQVRPWNKPTSETHGSLTFPKSFEKPPYIITALTSIDFAHDQNIRFKMSTTNITKAGFAWGLDTWDVSTLYSATASYIAFDQVGKDFIDSLLELQSNNGYAEYQREWSSPKTLCRHF